jgi:hypothetical protein
MKQENSVAKLGISAVYGGEEVKILRGAAITPKNYLSCLIDLAGGTWCPTCGCAAGSRMSCGQARDLTHPPKPHC